MTVLLPGLYGLDTSVAWRNLSKDPQKYIDKFSKDKTVQADIAYFNKKAPTITSVDDLIKDRRLLQFVLNAYGLGSEINNAGRIKQILKENPTDSNALANKLIDTRFKAMATDLRLDVGFNKFKLQISRDGIVDKFIVNQFEQNLGEQDPALRQAAYFARTAAGGSIANIYSVLGDKILRDVVQTTFNIPSQIAIQPVESQAAYLSKRVDVTKFGNLISTAVSAGQLQNAKTDFNLLDTSLKTSDAALTPLKTLSTQLGDLISKYSTLAADTDPLGSNAALITQQETAVPELVRFDELLKGGSDATATAKSLLNAMNDLISQAQDSGADLNDLKTQFAALATAASNAFDNAAITAPDGSTQNILLNGAADTISVTINTSGTTVTINRYDASSIQTVIQNANTAFQAIADSSDSSNIFTAQARILTSLDKVDVIDTQLSDDKTAFDTTVSGQSFYATLNSTDLLKGKNSVDDSLDRISQIEDLLGKIGDIADESADRLPSADRSDLVTKFNDYKQQIRDLIQNGGAGFDNYLNNFAGGTYEIINGQTIQVAGGYDLLADVADVLDTADISTRDNALLLQTTAIQVSVAVDDAKAGLNDSKPLLDRIVGTYDPKGSLDSAVLALKSNIDTLIDSAKTSDGKNLLSPDQTDIKLYLSTGTQITFRAQTTFKDDYTTFVDNAIAQLANGSAATADALDDLQSIVDRVVRNVGADNRTATIEQGKLGGIIDTLDPQNTASDDNPYKVNAFTQKFLTRYLTQVTLNNGGSTATGPNSYVLTLLGGGSASTDLTSLAVSLRV